MMYIGVYDKYQLPALSYCKPVEYITAQNILKIYEQSQCELCYPNTTLPVFSLMWLKYGILIMKFP